MPSCLPGENVAFEQRDRALRQTVREEFDGYRAHLAVEMQEDIPAHVEPRITEFRDFFRGQFNEGARRVEHHAREHCDMFAAALRKEAHHELISVGGCHAKERAEPEQPVQAPEELVGVVSSCGHVDPLEERFASWIGQQDRPFPSQCSSALLSDLRDTQPEDLQPRRAWAQFYEWLEDWSRARCDEMSQWAVLVTGPPGTGKTAGVRLLARHVRGTFLEL